MKLSSCCLCSLFPLCAACFLFVCAVCFLFLCTVCFLCVCTVCFLFDCTVCFLFVQPVSSLSVQSVSYLPVQSVSSLSVQSVSSLTVLSVSSLCVQSVSFSATMAMRNKQRPHLHTVCVTACNVFQNSFCFSHSVSSCVGNRAEHFKLTGGFEGLLEPDLHCEALASYMRPLSSKRETVKLLSCLCNLFPPPSQWRCGQCVFTVIPSLSIGPMICRILYSIPIDRTCDVSYLLFHLYRQDS